MLQEQVSTGHHRMVWAGAGQQPLRAVWKLSIGWTAWTGRPLRILSTLEVHVF